VKQTSVAAHLVQPLAHQNHGVVPRLSGVKGLSQAVHLLPRVGARLALPEDV
jgi:hypothetical protein